MDDHSNNQALMQAARAYLEDTQNAQRLSDIFEQDSRRYVCALREEEEAAQE